MSRTNFAFGIFGIALAMMVLRIPVSAQPPSGGGRAPRGTGIRKDPIFKPNPSKPPPAPRIYFAALELLVSPPGSKVCLPEVKVGPFKNGCVVVSEENSFIRLGKVKTGPYSITVEKMNYKQISRRINVTRGKNGRVEIVLRPTVAFVTILASNVSDPDIEITGNDFRRVYKGNLREMPVPTGRHTVRISKAGFQTYTGIIDASFVGITRPLVIPLTPVSTQGLIADAKKKLEMGRLEEAIEISSQVIAISPDAGRAHLVKGLALFEKGSSEAGAALLRAIELGESVSIPFMLYLKEGRGALIDGVLSIANEGLSFGGLARKDINFTIPRTNVTVLTQTVDASNISLTQFKGRGDFAGKRAERQITLYSKSARLRADSLSTFCPEPTSGLFRCNSDSDILYGFLRVWLGNSRK